MPRSERRWQWPGSSRCSCTVCGRAGRSTIPSATPIDANVGRRLLRGGNREAKDEVLACHSVGRKAVSEAASRGPSLRISSIRRVRHANLVHPLWRRRERSEDRSASLVARIKADLILCTEPPEERELTESA